MINREDMLELTRRMTPARASVGRIAGAYFDEEGYVDGTFNTNFLKLSASERTRNLNMAKTVLISKTNEQLKEYRITKEMGKSIVPMILSVIGTVGTRIVWIFGIFPRFRSLKILFISYPASWIITIILQVICFIFVRRIVYAPLKKREAMI